MRPYRGFRHRGRLRGAGPERAGDIAARLFAPRDTDPAAPRTVRGATRGAIARAVDDQAPASVRLKGRHAAFYWQLGLDLALPPAKRKDAPESVHRFARLLAARADRRDGTTFHSRARRCSDAGLSPTTWKRCRRQLAAAGALVTVYPGCRRYDDHGNVRYDAAVYALVLPRRIVRKIAAARRAASSRRRSGPPRSSGTGLLTDPRVTPEKSERGAPYGRPDRLARPPAAAGARAGPGGRRPGGRLYGQGQTGAQPRIPAIERAMLAAGFAPADVAQLLDRWPTGHPEPRRRAAIEAPLLAAGWTRADLGHAYDCRPGGRRHAHTDPARAPVALLRWRLAQWLDPADRAAVEAGQLPWHLARFLPSRSQQLAAADAARRADQAAWRATRGAAAAAKAPASVRDSILSQLRARMGWTADDRPRPRAAPPESGNDQEGPP